MNVYFRHGTNLLRVEISTDNVDIALAETQKIALEEKAIPDSPILAVIPGSK